MSLTRGGRCCSTRTAPPPVTAGGADRPLEELDRLHIPFYTRLHPPK